MDENQGWHRAHTLILIKELQKYECLYNRLNESFTNKSIRLEKINLICDKLKSIKPNVTVDGIRKKIKSLKSQLWKQQQMVINSKKNRSAADAIYEPTLWCYRELSFLLYANNREPSQANIDLVESGIDQKLNDNLEDSGSGITPEKKGKNKTTDFENKPMQQPLGKEEAFCQYLCSLLKKIKLEEKFGHISLQIITLVHQKISEERKKLQASNNFSPINNSLSFIEPSFRNTSASSLHQRDELAYIPKSSTGNSLESTSSSLHELPETDSPYSSKLNNPLLEFRGQYTICSYRNSPDIPPTHEGFQSSSLTSSTNSLNIRTASPTLHHQPDPFHFPYNQAKPYLSKSSSQSSLVNRNSLDIASPTTLNSFRSLPNPEKKIKNCLYNIPYPNSKFHTNFNKSVKKTTSSLPQHLTDAVIPCSNPTTFHRSIESTDNKFSILRSQLLKVSPVKRTPDKNLLELALEGVFPDNIKDV